MCEFCADPFDEDCFACGKLIAGSLKDKNVAKKIKEGYLCADCMKLELVKCQGCGSMVPKSELKIVTVKSGLKKQIAVCRSCVADIEPCILSLIASTQNI